MTKILLSAFSDEYNSDIDIQIKMLRENGLNYIEPRFIGSKNIADLTGSEVKDASCNADTSQPLSLLTSFSIAVADNLIFPLITYDM